MKGIIITIFGMFFAFFVMAVAAFVGVNNDLVQQEEAIKAQYKQNQNNYDNMWKKFKEVAEVPSVYTEDLKKVYNAAITNRYGKEGAQAAFQWIKEHNPNFDASMYKQIQQVVETGRNNFEANQKMLLDKKREYVTTLRVFPNNMVASFLGYPKIELSKYDIITSQETKTVFDNKESKQIKLRD